MTGRTDYDRALDYLYSFVDYSLKHISELAKADFNLDRMFALMEALGNPQQHYRIIHVAGTKGKGSVSAMVAAVLRAAGYETGLYTSPHLTDYVERIQVNGRPISHAALARLVDQVRPAVDRIPRLTTFEITTATGLLAFRLRNVDFAVVEVGLGGRLDATNIVLPAVAVITSLSMDHMLVLGDTLEKIAAEKAGIIKAGVPVIVAPQKPEALEVLRRIAAERGAPLTIVGKDVEFHGDARTLRGQHLTVSRVQVSAPTALAGGAEIQARIPLLGEHQMENAALAVAVVWELRAQGTRITTAAIRAGLSRVRWPARFEVLRREPPVVIDSAHNRDSARRLRETLRAFFPGRPAILIFCALEDKDIPGMLDELRPVVERVIVTRADHPRAPRIEWLAEQVSKAGLPVEARAKASSALSRALALAGSRSLVLVAGSVAFAGEMRALWLKQHKPAAGDKAASRARSRGTPGVPKK